MRNPLKTCRRLNPQPARKNMTVVDLVDGMFRAYNGGRLREACQLFTKTMLANGGVVGLTLTGALTPAGLGKSCVVPLIKAGFVDWIVSTGANLYHDLHYALDLALHCGSPFVNDLALRRHNVARIYDIYLSNAVLLDTDAFIRKVIRGTEFQRVMGTDEFHYRLGRYVRARERTLGLRDVSILSAAHAHGVPVFTSSPGDSSIGMEIAANALQDNRLQFDVNRDVNQSTAIVYDTKRRKRNSHILIMGGGSPKNFILQTEPQLQDMLKIREKGHDSMIQCTDARPDTGGLSGATPSEAVSWLKIDPDKLANCVVCYLDTTVALPILSAYALSSCRPRQSKRLYDRRDAMLENLRRKFLRAGKA